MTNVPDESEHIRSSQWKYESIRFKFRGSRGNICRGQWMRAENKAKILACEDEDKC